MANMCWNVCDIKGPIAQINKTYKQIESLRQLPGLVGTRNAVTTSFKSSIDTTALAEWKVKNKLRIEGFMFDEDCEGRTISFSTKWNPDTDIIKSMSEFYPALTFTCGYDESGNDIGGRFVYKAGECLEEDHGCSEDSTFNTEEAELVLAAATLPLHEAMNFVNLSELEGTLESPSGENVNGELIKKALAWNIGGNTLGKWTTRGRNKKGYKSLLETLDVGLGRSWTGSRDSTVEDEKSLLKISRAVKSKEEFAWLHAMLTGSKDLSVAMIDDHTISLELVGVEVSNRPTSENTLLTGKVASAIADITNLQPREAYQMYEILVLGVKLPDIQFESWNRSAVGFSPLVTPEAAEAAKDLVAFPKGCRELNIESYYPVYFLPTIDIEEFEEKVAEMTATVKRLRELKNMHKDRYPSTVKEVMIKIVEAICLNYMNYMNHTSNTDIKFMGLLANAVAQGYETDKILQRLGKALDAKHIR
jgi:hypothetical protein